eukprot:scaffold673253_cov36-Prasinocladus_malaysianus.AAC.1
MESTNVSMEAQPVFVPSTTQHLKMPRPRSKTFVGRSGELCQLLHRLTRHKDERHAVDCVA